MRGDRRNRLGFIALRAIALSTIATIALRPIAPVRSAPGRGFRGFGLSGSRVGGTHRVARVRIPRQGRPSGPASRSRMPVLRSPIRTQRGLGFLALIVIAIMVGFFVLCGIKLIPSYVEYLTVKQVSIRLAKEFVKDEDTIYDIRRDLASYLNINQVKGVDYREVDISRKDGKIIIDSSYEHRIPLFWRVDVVMKYDDLQFEAGVDYSKE